MYKFLGWFNVALLIFNFLSYSLRVINKRIKSKILTDIIKFLKKYHKISGVLLIIFGFVHGYLALGYNFYLHTGSILWVLIISMFASFIIGKFSLFKHKWIYFHRILSFSLLVFLLIHLINPWLF
ncbi:hypothetical protein H17ap60334_07338 [Thermosipho africanus H17ap60334]|jgi:hypothetical protein|uniref:hypothetical protein n=1 Tax=Thermosipho africanus TaxID=2421 RepID=UPI00028C1229|nr:hypothetical protein [Thermosipho africanus]EKF49120.1 hypothetical protein H17ap60334_07338 [Thermosipho africanus H17ap60334]MDK2885796.1 hypothetical protein [Thermosipho sp. (in: thermotogales)]